MAFIASSASREIEDLKRHKFSKTMSRKSARSTPCNGPINHDEPVGKGVIVLNIAGKRFETFEETLARYPDTLLGDPAKRRRFYNPHNGEYFFDRNRSAFNGILYYYQSNGILECPEKVSESAFTKEVLFFGLEESLLGLNDDDNGLEDIEEEELPKNLFLRKVWILFEHPNSSIIAKIVAVFSVLVILISIIVFCIETLPHLDPNKPESNAYRDQIKLTWLVLNTFCNSWFTIEYVMRFIASPNKLKFVRSSINIIDLVSILPFYLSIILGEGGGIEVLRVIRVIRVIRIFKLTRHSRGLHILGNTIHASMHELAMLALFLFIGVILFSSAVYYSESQVDSQDFPSIPHSFWWAVVTMTTVGYGDITPTTLIGKLVGAMCAISGVLVIALPVPVIVSNFEHYYKAEKARQERLEERERKESNVKNETNIFSTFVSPNHSSDGEGKTFLNKIRRLPSLIRKVSTVSANNGHANVENEEETNYLNSCPEVHSETELKFKSPCTPEQQDRSTSQTCSVEDIDKNNSDNETTL